METENAITREWLDEVLQGVDLQTNPYSIVRLMLDRDQRGKIISVLLPKLIQQTAKAQVIGGDLETKL